MSRVDEVPEANRVRLDRISQRLEYRTTVMIKDIPNKLSRAVSPRGNVPREEDGEGKRRN